MSSGKPLMSDESDLRILLVGKVKSGKTSLLQSLLKHSSSSSPSSSTSSTPPPSPPPSPSSPFVTVPMGTETCQKHELKNFGEKKERKQRRAFIVDTPGLCHAEKTDKELTEELKKGLSMLAPGPHVFLLTLSLLNKFTEEESQMAALLKQTFGEKFWEHALVVFTHGNALKKKEKQQQQQQQQNQKNGKQNGGGCSIEGYLKESEDLSALVERCRGGFCVLDNLNEQEDEVSDVMQQIEALALGRNQGRVFKLKEGVKLGRVKKVSLAVNGGALTGAAVGGLASQAAGGALAVGLPIGIVGGAMAGGVLGGAGIVIAEHVKAKTAKANCLIM